MQEINTCNKSTIKKIIEMHTTVTHRKQKPFFIWDGGIDIPQEFHYNKAILTSPNPRMGKEIKIGKEKYKGLVVNNIKNTFNSGLELGHFRSEMSKLQKDVPKKIGDVEVERKLVEVPNSFLFDEHYYLYNFPRVLSSKKIDWNTVASEVQKICPDSSPQEIAKGQILTHKFAHFFNDEIVEVLLNEIDPVKISTLTNIKKENLKEEFEDLIAQSEKLKEIGYKLEGKFLEIQTPEIARSIPYFTTSDLKREMKKLDEEKNLLLHYFNPPNGKQYVEEVMKFLGEK